jgi:hypothetical protein
MLFQALRDPVIQGILIAVVAILAVGCVFYSLVEGWSLLDSIYFCVASLTTVGYGDLAPETAAGKLFTVLYLISGVALMAAAGTTIVQRTRLWSRIEERGGQRDDPAK